MQLRTCRHCGKEFPLTRDNYGNTPSGGFRWKCRACVRAHVSAYDQRNKAGAAERVSIRTFRERRAGGEGYSASDLIAIRKNLGDRCAYCDVPLNGGGHIDHKTPVAQGGKTGATNITLCCVKCNLAKHAKTVEEFLRWRIARGLGVRTPRVV